MAKKKTSEFTKEEIQENIRQGNFYGFQLDKEQEIFRDAILSDDKLIVFCNAKAGTGKTQIAFGTANLLYHSGDYDGIVCVVFPCAENKQGYLPGDITQKSEVYFEPMYQAMIKCGVEPERYIDDNSMTKQKTGEAYIKLLTSTYLRGTNFENKVVIIDEAQNGTVEELKKVLTRCADSNKVVVVGHTGQIDLQNPKQSGFSRYIEHFGNTDKSQICTLTKNYRGWISSFADELYV